MRNGLLACGLLLVAAGVLGVLWVLGDSNPNGSSPAGALPPSAMFEEPAEYQSAPRQSEPVSVAPRERVEAVLSPEWGPTVTLGGQVVDEEGTPLENVLLRAYPIRNGASIMSKSTRTDSAGVWELRGLPLSQKFGLTGDPRQVVGRHFADPLRVEAGDIQRAVAGQFVTLVARPGVKLRVKVSSEWEYSRTGGSGMLNFTRLDAPEHWGPWTLHPHLDEGDAFNLDHLEAGVYRVELADRSRDPPLEQHTLVIPPETAEGETVFFDLSR